MPTRVSPHLNGKPSRSRPRRHQLNVRCALLGAVSSFIACACNFRRSLSLAMLVGGGDVASESDRGTRQAGDASRYPTGRWRSERLGPCPGTIHVIVGHYACNCTVSAVGVFWALGSNRIMESFSSRAVTSCRQPDVRVAHVHVGLGLDSCRRSATAHICP